MEIFFSTVQPKLKRRFIKRSSLFALPGFFLLLYMGIFLSIASLEIWGIWGFSLGFTLISYGMIPYRKITRLATKPHSISLEKKGLCFKHTKQGEVLFPNDQMTALSFVEKKGFYGIQIHLKDESHFLLPYFSKKTYQAIQKKIREENR